MAVIVVATIRPLPDHRDDVIAIMESAIAQVHAEGGCELYSLHEGDGLLVMIEKWSSQEALDAHLVAPALVELVRKTKGLTDGPADIQVLRPHPAGTPAQGAL